MAGGPSLLPPPPAPAGGILSRVNDRRFLGTLALVSLVLPVFLAAQAQRTEPPPPTPPTAFRQPAVIFEGGEIPVPVIITPAGPTFGLAALANNLGGKLSPEVEGESFNLDLEGKEVVIGVGSSIITVGDNIVSLSQPVARGESTLQVPLDFLQRTFGDLLGYSFEWRPELQRLLIAKRAARELPVFLDVVHLQGMTTVVLQFTEAPRYQIQRQPGQILVQMAGDRLAPPVQPPAVADPLVQSVTIAPEQIRIQTVPAAEVSSYVLEGPYRIVFDVHLASAAEMPVSPGLRPAPRPLSPGVRTIVLDPGHGGAETGAISPSGVAEKELTLVLARDLKARLEGSLGVSVVLTRNDDASLPHETRTAIANQNQADLFISLHLNSSIGSGAHGAETYFLSTEPTDVRAARAAESENTTITEPAVPEGTTGLEARDLQLILWDLAQTHHLAESQRFANLIQGELNQALQLRDRGVKQAPFRVLVGAAMPAVLVELGFISNPEEEKKLQDAAYRSALVEALTRAVGRYKALVENRPDPTTTQPGTQPAPAPGAVTPQAPATPGRPPAQPQPRPPAQGPRKP